MKKPQVTTTTGWSGILGVWLAVFGTSLPAECLDIMWAMTIQQWVQLIAPTIVFIWSIFFIDENKPTKKPNTTDPT
ncbi:MAG: hypothetical protein GY941_23655 [Planctomycetes bacterium]|nr:hypothetical protein [Planctomycetota bacterium]